MSMCGYVCVCLHLSVSIILPIWHFRPTAARYRVWLISGAELAVEGGVLKGPECEESSQLSLPAVLFHYFTFLIHNFKHCVFMPVWFCLLLQGGSFCVLV